MQTLHELYMDQLQDLWSANRQAGNMADALAQASQDARLRDVLTRSVARINQHNERLAQMIQEEGYGLTQEHCKGMEGLVHEARRHALETDCENAALRDAQIIAQFQRISHYGLAVYGVCAALAKQLGRSTEAASLAEDLQQVRKGDQVLTEIAESQVHQHAAA